MKRLAIIGGGAAGMMAAITAAEHGAEVIIFEANDRLGKKILATGNGRCNMTNLNADTIHYHGENPSFIDDVKSDFWVDETLQKFRSIGVITRTEENGKVYPYCCTASAVSEALRAKITQLGINVRTEFEVKDIIKKNNGFMLVSYNNEREKVNAVIIATGGKASPSSGSKGGGYPLLKKFGHTVTELKPSLVQIKTEPETVKKLKGIKLNARAKIGNTTDEGEILFTDYGLSGPPVFYLSAYIDNHSLITLDFMPDFSQEQIEKILKEKATNCPDTTLEGFMSGIINKKLGQILLKKAGISPLSKKASELTDNDITAVAALIKKTDFKIEGTMSWNNAQVTKGGVRTSEFNSRTMESLLISGIFAAGEILDIDGDCGGYNLQWAWSSGYTAGKNAAEYLIKGDNKNA